LLLKDAELLILNVLLGAAYKRSAGASTDLSSTAVSCRINHIVNRTFVGSSMALLMATLSVHLQLASTIFDLADVARTVPCQLPDIYFVLFLYLLHLIRVDQCGKGYVGTEGLALVKVEERAVFIVHLRLKCLRQKTWTLLL